MYRTFSLPIEQRLQCLSDLRFMPGVLALQDGDLIGVELTTAAIASAEQQAERKSDPSGWAEVNALVTAYGGRSVP